MKTAISLPDDLFQAGERAAARLEVSRSELYALALVAFLREQEREAVTTAIDRVLSGRTYKLDPVLARLQASSLAEGEGPIEDWTDLPMRGRKRRVKGG
jgi:hypothetical protein